MTSSFDPRYKNDTWLGPSYPEEHADTRFVYLSLAMSTQQAISNKTDAILGIFDNGRQKRRYIPPENSFFLKIAFSPHVSVDLRHNNMNLAKLISKIRK